MKKTLSLVLALITLLFCLVGCNNSKEIVLTDEDIHTDYAGVYLTLSSVDDSGEYKKLNAVWHNETTKTVTYGNWFVIEKKDGENWTDVSTADVQFTEEAYVLEANKTNEKSYTTKFADISGEGTYRVRTEFHVQESDGSSKRGITWIEFEVKKATAAKHKLTVDDHADMLIEKVDGKYASGEVVTIKTEILMDAYLEFSLNGEVLELKETPIENAKGEYTHWEFYITMPNEDAVLTYEIKDGFLVDPIQPGGTDVHDAFDIRISWANWLDGTTVDEGCLNFAQLAISSVHHIPLHKFSSRSELEAFKARFGEDNSFDYGYNGKSFNENTADYDDAFFEENDLFLVYVDANSGSLHFDVNSIFNDGQIFCIYVNQTNNPEDVTDDMAGWFITVAMPKSATENCTAFDAIIGYPQ